MSKTSRILKLEGVRMIILRKKSLVHKDQYKQQMPPYDGQKQEYIKGRIKLTNENNPKKH